MRGRWLGAKHTSVRTLQSLEEERLSDWVYSPQERMPHHQSLRIDAGRRPSTTLHAYFPPLGPSLSHQLAGLKEWLGSRHGHTTSVLPWGTVPVGLELTSSWLPSNVQRGPNKQ